MARTCHQCRGHSENYKEANLKRCAGCQKVYYCSNTCQKYDWVVHIFDCKPKRPINTADHLALAIRKNLFPDHLQTCEDFGFSRAVSTNDRFNLLALYIALIRVLEIPPKTIHDWRVRGVLSDEIKAAFEKLPEHARGGHFSWFLRNQHVIVLAGQPLSNEAWHRQGDEMVLFAWRFIGGSREDPAAEVKATITAKPPKERQCFWMYVFILSCIYPSPGEDPWVDFGFASCTSRHEETELGKQYQRLILKCTFSDFYEAYREGRLLELFHSKGLQVANSNQFQDLVRGSAGRKSVWHLKRFIFQEDDEENEAKIHPAVMVEYGFINCRTESERRQLKRVYRAFFESHGGDPLVLHEAAMREDIHGFLSKRMQGLRDPKFRRLMKNQYPLPDA